jgi:hypothetical protein
MGDAVLTLLPVTMVLGLYLFPSLVAISRRHHQRAAIVALNLLLGWTLVGWVISLVWALTATPGATTR